jgi:DNA polymerase-3 subunit epsilon
MPLQHPNYKDQRDAIDWARSVLKKWKKYVILDTETTGIKGADEIIQIAVIDLMGTVLFNENIRPSKKKRIAAEAIAVHGISMKSLEGCPTFADLEKPLKKAIGRRTIISYNAEFDARLYRQTYQLAGGFLPRGEWECAMLQYARFIGEWNSYYNSYKWQKLDGGDHTALGDCLATLEVIRVMAGAIKIKKWYEIWIGK